MRLRYLVKETSDGIRRARISFLVSVVTLTFFLMLVGFFSIVSSNLRYLTGLVRSQMQIQAFLANTLEEGQISALRARVAAIPGIERVDFISKEDAAQEFQKEFGRDLFNILDENPLPSSFSLVIRENDRNETEMQRIAGLVQKEPGIEEVVYNNQTVMTLNRYARLAATVNWFILAFITLGSIFVISNNIRLVILSRKQIIETMQLVGATPAHIRLPLMLEGALQGILGGLLAAVLLYAFLALLNTQISGLARIPAGDHWILVGVGLSFGLLGSQLAIRRYL